MEDKFKTYLGYGFYITEKEVRELKERNRTLYQKFLSNPWATPLDQRGRPFCNYFFGLIWGCITPGYGIDVPTRRDYSHQDILKTLNQFKEFFPNQTVYIMKDYVLSCIY